MTHRQVLEALSGLLLGMFVAILSSTIVSTALPRIIADLDGNQGSYTWVVTASLLSMTASTPLWGKLADLTSKKLLVQSALIIFVLASAGAGLSQNAGTLIAFRAVQGLGMGGLAALAQIILAAMISPRERGRYSGYLGATFAIATVGGPLLGGVITDTSWLGWRWCFYVAIPFAVIALVVLQKTLRLPVVKRANVRIDWAGSLVFAASVSLLLVWVTLAGDSYDWVSWQTYAMVGGSILLALLFLLIESKAAEPIVPLRLFRNRTVSLASFGSMFVGVAMFGATVFLSQYFQLARGQSPTMAGVSTIPMIAGIFLSSTVSGQAITRTGRWKAWLVVGGILLTGACGLLGTMRHDTPYWHLAIYMALMGLGVGMMMQNLVLCTQNQVTPQDLGAASSLVTFLRSLGGAVGVSVLGAVLDERTRELMAKGLAAIGIKQDGDGGGSLPNLAELPAPVRAVVESSYGKGIADIYLFAAPISLVALLLVLFIKEVPLNTKSAMEQEAEPEDGTGLGAGHPGGPGAPVDHDPALASATAVPPEAVTVTPEGSPDFRQAPIGYPTYAIPADPAHDSVPSPVGGGVIAPGGSGIAVRGTVRGAEGGLPRAAITLISADGRQLGRSVAHRDGQYALDAPAPGSYVLIAAADGHQPLASTVHVGTEPLHHDILLGGVSGLTGVAHDAENGELVPGAVVVVTDARGEVVASGRTGEYGEFRFDELVTGTFTVAVNAAGYRPTARPVEVTGPGATRIEIPLAQGARVHGTVLAGPGRQPLPDARVTLLDAAGSVIATVTTGPDGAYAFTDLDAGEYSLVASGYPAVSSRLTVEGDGVEAVDIELRHPDN
ncbi:MFS transporter [Streptomyces sp. AJS327]|nr:MFS transporter [Streptomyces sp. AJS327]MBA0052692.1 MFS transporter [Streptomyces sp. AJS327]